MNLPDIRDVHKFRQKWLDVPEPTEPLRLVPPSRNIEPLLDDMQEIESLLEERSRAMLEEKDKRRCP